MLSRPALALLAAATLSCVAGPAPSAKSLSLGRTVRFDLPTDRGDLVTLPDPDARTTVLVVWSPSEPGACRDRVAALFNKRDKLESRNARIVLVAALAENETARDASATLSTWGVNAPFLIDREHRSATEAGARGIPATVVMVDGVVRWVAPEGASAEDVIRAVP